MNLTGNYTFNNAPRQLVWEMFLDTAVLAAIMPGCERLERVGENRYEGEMKLKVGPVQGVFQGTVELSDLQAPESYHMKVNGKGSSGIVDGSGDVRLEETDAGTIMHYEGVAHVSGRIASVGQRLMDTSAKAITRQSLQNLDAQIQARLHPERAAMPATEQPAPAVTTLPPTSGNGAPYVSGRPIPLPPPTQTEFALGVAREMAGDLLPEEKNQQIVAGILALASVYFLFNLFLNWWTKKLARQLAKELKKNREHHSTTETPWVAARHHE